MKNKKMKMKMMTLDQMKDKDIGKVGTPERDKYEFDLRMGYTKKTLQRKFFVGFFTSSYSDKSY